MKTIDEILDEAHQGRDFNYSDIKIAFGIFRKQQLDIFHNMLFRGKQLQIWCTLTNTPQSCGEISKITGIESRNVSTQIKQMMKKGLIKFTQSGKFKYYYKQPLKA